MSDLKQFKEYIVDWGEGRVAMEDGAYLFAYGIDGLRLWIERALRKENKRLFYEGLGKNYGHEIYKLMGRTLNESLVSLVFQNVSETLCANPYIKAVSLKEYFIEGDKLNLTLDVTTVYDRIEITEVYSI